MIVELFGPPGSGKTTAAHAIASRLRGRGRSVDLKLSYRPGEEGSPIYVGGRRHNVLMSAQRVARPFGELVSRMMTARGEEEDTIATAVRLLLSLPQCSFLQSLRFRQYLMRLSAVWREAARSDAISVFDQGYIQVLSSLILMARSVSDEQAATVLDCLPCPDLAIQISAPLNSLEMRLRDRDRVLGPIGRLLEDNPGTLTDRIAVAERLYRLIEQGGRKITRIQCHDELEYHAGLARAESEILALAAAERHERLDALRAGAHPQSTEEDDPPRLASPGLRFMDG